MKSMLGLPAHDRGRVRVKPAIQAGRALDDHRSVGTTPWPENLVYLNCRRISFGIPGSVGQVHIVTLILAVHTGFLVRMPDVQPNLQVCRLFEVGRPEVVLVNPGQGVSSTIDSDSDGGGEHNSCNPFTHIGEFVLVSHPGSVLTPTSHLYFANRAKMTLASDSLKSLKLDGRLAWFERGSLVLMTVKLPGEPEASR